MLRRLLAPVLSALGLMLLVSQSVAQQADKRSDAVWTPAPIQLVEGTRPHDALPWLAKYRSYRLDLQTLSEKLAAAPHEHSGLSGVLVELPTPDGGMQRFRVHGSALLSPAVARLVPYVKVYVGQGIDDPTAVLRMDVGPNGFHGMVLSVHGDYVIDPVAKGDTRQYIVYYRRDNSQPRSFSCGTYAPARGGFEAMNSILALVTLKTYRLALNATGEYTNFFGSEANANNGAITSVNRVDGVYTVDFAIRFNLVYLKCYTNPGTDPFSNGSGGAMLGQNQTTCDALVGNANYDFGHVFSTGGGGVAGLRVVGVTGQKARGVTGQFQPTGDPFDIDYVAHEMGHQFGANHTFNGTTGSCGGNRVSSAAYEPGSGSTIMAYAGICGSEDLQPHSDPYFHVKSFDEIIAWKNNAGSGGTASSTTNNFPTVNAGPNFTIPQSTPFKLTAVGADVDGDPLTYCWEQFDLGHASPTSNNTTRPLFRSFIPTSNPTRFFPRLADTLSGAPTPWEILPNVNRTLTWRCSVRDNRTVGGGLAYDTAVVTVSGSPFAVTSPNTNVTWSAGSSQTVTWTVGGGSVSPNVNIYLSTNGGNSYGTGTATLLKSNVPNDGSETITVPGVATSQARIIVEAASSVFFDVSNVNFTITVPTPQITGLSPNSAQALSGGFTLTVNGNNFTSGSVVRWNGANRTTNFVSANQLTATIPGSDLATVGTATVTVQNPGGSTSNGAVFNILPITVAPTAFDAVFGTHSGGNLGSLGSSDDNWLSVDWEVPPVRTDPLVVLELSSSSAALGASQLSFRLETHVDALPANSQTQQIELFNHSSGNWELVDSRVCTGADSVASLSFTSNAGRFIHPSTGEVRARVRSFFTLGVGTTNRNWSVFVDQAQWTIHP